MFYTALTQYLGFPKYGDEYKVMGLASYGEPEVLEEFHKIVIAPNGGRMDFHARAGIFHLSEVRRRDDVGRGRADNRKTVLEVSLRNGLARSAIRLRTLKSGISPSRRRCSAGWRK